MNPHLREWRARGRELTIGGHRVFVAELGSGDATPLVVIHGFAGSSYDFAEVAERVARERPVILLDLLGFGFSDKPRSASYSLFEQADLVESVLAALVVTSCALLAHDMGDTVAAELLHRHNDGDLGFTPESVVLTNGSIFIDLAHLTAGQRGMLRLPAAALPFPLPGWLLRRALARSFAKEAPAPPGAIGALVELIQFNGGAHLLPRQNRYLLERRKHQPRWTAALVDFRGPLTLIWGSHDPIATPAMPQRLRRLRPQTRTVLLDDVGHWPSLEAPERLADLLTNAV